MNRLVWIAIVCLALTAGCKGKDDGPAEPPAVEAQRSVEVTSIELGNTITAEKRVEKATDDFSPGDTIYASIATSGARLAELEAVWTFEDGQVVAADTTKIEPNGTAYTEFHIYKPDGLPEGKYTVTIKLDGKEVEQKTFDVDA